MELKEKQIVEFSEDYGDVEKGTVARVELVGKTAVFVKWVAPSGHWVTEKLDPEVALVILVETEKKLNTDVEPDVHKN